MPKVQSSTPQWLCRPSQGFNLFHAGPQRKQSINSSQYNTSEYRGAHRLIARRGSEIFVVVNNQIRWADLCLLKDEWDVYRDSSRWRSRRSRSFTPDGGDASQDDGDDRKAKGYRVLQVGSIAQIRQLIPSPGGNYLAILTANTVHIALMPDPSHLASRDESPIKLKYHQLGPTIHTLPLAPVMATLWHPLGPEKNTLVTVTSDAVVRVWEFKPDNAWTFDQPEMAIDLRKLVDGTSSDENFEPQAFGYRKGFSADEADMEVASACFGGIGLDVEDGWAPMTLWVAMRNRDLYALCPLLPSKWQPTSTIIPSLSTNVVSKASVLYDDPTTTDVERKISDQQFRWFSDIDNQDPMMSPSGYEIYNRPTSIGPIPKLQGPYIFDLPEGIEDDESEVTDVLAIAAKLDADELLAAEDEDIGSEFESLTVGGVSTTLICLVTETGKIFTCLDLDGVEGQWLPKLRHKAFAIPSNPSSNLTLVSTEALTHPPTDPSEWPVFSQDASNRYEFYVTAMKSVESFSLGSWAEALERELNSPDTSGLAFRLKILCSADSNPVDKVPIIHDASSSDISNSDTRAREGRHLNACLLYQDISQNGRLLLTSNLHRPFAAIIDYPWGESLDVNILPSIEEDPRAPAPARTPSLDSVESVQRPRSPYQPPQIFFSDAPLTYAIESNISARHRSTLKKEIKLSPATLDAMTASHRILSTETSKLESAAADLFRRCERLKDEMIDQVQRLRDVAERVDRVVEESEVGDEQEEEEVTGEQGKVQSKIDMRLKAAGKRQEELGARFDALRKKVSQGAGRELSEKEVAWKSEIERLEQRIFGLKDSRHSDGREEARGDEAQEKGRRRISLDDRDKALWDRFEVVKSLSAELLSQVKSTPTSIQPTTTTTTNSPTMASSSRRQKTGTADQLSRIPPTVQRKKVGEAMGMVEREAAIIDALTARLDRLNMRGIVGVSAV